MTTRLFLECGIRGGRGARSLLLAAGSREGGRVQQDFFSFMLSHSSPALARLMPLAPIHLRAKRLKRCVSGQLLDRQQT